MGDPCMNVPNGPDKDSCYAGMNGGHHDGPQGEHHDGPPIDPRSGQPFTQADEAKFQKYADECDATKGLLSQGSADELVKEGFTRIQVEDLCKMSADNGEHHDGPPGMHRGQGQGPTFKDCKSIKPKGNVDMMRDKKNCFRDVAKSLGAKGAKSGFGKCRSIKPRGDFALMKQKKNCFRDVAKSLR